MHWGYHLMIFDPSNLNSPPASNEWKICHYYIFKRQHKQNTSNNIPSEGGGKGNIFWASLSISEDPGNAYFSWFLNLHVFRLFFILLQSSFLDEICNFFAGKLMVFHLAWCSSQGWGIHYLYIIINIFTLFGQPKSWAGEGALFQGLLREVFLLVETKSKKGRRTLKTVKLPDWTANEGGCIEDHFLFLLSFFFANPSCPGAVPVISHHPGKAAILLFSLGFILDGTAWKGVCPGTSLRMSAWEEVPPGNGFRSQTFTLANRVFSFAFPRSGRPAPLPLGSLSLCLADPQPRRDRQKCCSVSTKVQPAMCIICAAEGTSLRAKPDSVLGCTCIGSCASFPSPPFLLPEQTVGGPPTSVGGGEAAWGERILSPQRTFAKSAKMGNFLKFFAGKWQKATDWGRKGEKYVK